MNVKGEKWGLSFTHGCSSATNVLGMSRQAHYELELFLFLESHDQQQPKSKRCNFFYTILHRISDLYI